MFLFKLQSKSLGDTIAFLHVVELFRTKNSLDKVGVIVNNPNFYKNTYPNLDLYKLETEPIENDDIYTIPVGKINHQYKYFQRIFYKFHEGLMEGFARQLRCLDALKIDEFPNIDFYDPNGVEEKTICFSIHSTAQLKHWNNPNGWKELIDKLKSEGYKVINVDYNSRYGSEDNWNDVPDNCIRKNGLSIPDVAKIINRCEFFIGISGGLSWLAHALHKPVVMISPMTEAEHEFKHKVLRIVGSAGCRGCFNNPTYTFDSNDWNWCPENKGTPHHFICSKSITSDYVFSKINHWLEGEKETLFA